MLLKSVNLITINPGQPDYRLFYAHLCTLHYHKIFKNFEKQSINEKRVKKIEHEQQMHRRHDILVLSIADKNENTCQFYTQ